MNTIMDNARTLIHKHRDRGRTIVAIAKLAGVSPRTIQAWEAGVVGTLPRVEAAIAKLGEALRRDDREAAKKEGW